MKAGLVQLCSSDCPDENLISTRQYIREAAEKGADIVLTPEVTNCVSSSIDHLNSVLRVEPEDETLKALRDEAKSLGIWLLIGSLALKTGEPDGRFANRSFMISPDGEICGRYDKLHMFDVNIGPNEQYHESKRYRPGSNATVVETEIGKIGNTICYDLRFPYLYRALAKSGAQILTVPSAFSPTTGQAHWEVLLRARAIETGCFVLAPAQCGVHKSTSGKSRSTWGHSLAVNPWGDVIADGGEEPGVTVVEVDLGQVATARSRIPSLEHDREFGGLT